MEKTKILDLIPENLREDLIKEVAELLKQREKQKPATKEEIDSVTTTLKI